MVPSSLTNRNKFPLNAPVALAVLKTCPVGVPEAGGGITTPPDASGGDRKVTLVVTLVFGLTWYRVVTPVALSETQNGASVEYEIPQAFFKNASVIWAGLIAWSSVTRFVT